MESEGVEVRKKLSRRNCRADLRLRVQIYSPGFSNIIAITVLS